MYTTEVLLRPPEGSLTALQAAGAGDSRDIAKGGPRAPGKFRVGRALICGPLKDEEANRATETDRAHCPSGRVSRWLGCSTNAETLEMAIPLRRERMRGAL